MKIGIVGTGIIGLCCGYFLSKQGHEVTLFGKDPQAGGMAGGFKLGDTWLDKYYHHLFAGDKHAVGLIDEIGLSKKLSWNRSQMGLYYNGVTYPFSIPSDLLSFKPLSLKDKLRFGLTTLYLQKYADWKKLQDVPVAVWLKKYAGERAYRIIWEPLLRIKFGANHDKVSAAWFCYRLRLRGNTRTSRCGYEELGYLDGSFQSLITELENKISFYGSRIYHSNEIIKIERSSDSLCMSVFTEDNNFKFDKVVVTTAIPQFLEIANNMPEKYLSSLRSIEYRAIACLILELDRSLSEFYWLNIADTNIPFGGVLEHTRLISPKHYDGSHIVYLSNYLSKTDKEYGLNRAELISEYENSIQSVFPGFDPRCIKSAFLFRDIFAQPIVEVGYQNNIPKFNTPVDGLYLATMAQIYPEDRGLNSSIKLAKDITAILGNND